ncbi:hypothetical protein FFF34_015865 [Inquilinus sp. KBS0705]|nr:hypothetical protein FFF34_015865 [Inquilinus sp. KBS0705]
MKLLFKYIIYSFVIVLIVTSFLDVFRNHPEAQLAFIFPGVILLAFSQIMDDIFPNVPMRMRLNRINNNHIANK